MSASYDIAPVSARARAYVTLARTVMRMVAFAVTTVALLIVPCSASAVGVGQLDETFNGTGTVVTPVSGGFSDVIVDTSGNTIAVGWNGSDVLVAKYLPNGSLDTSFVGGGIVTFSVSAGNDAATAVALTSGGDIVVAGSSELGQIRSFVRMLTPNGFYLWNFALDLPVGDDEIEDIQISADNRITFAGTTATGLGKDVLIGRLNTDGTLDTSFNSGGWRAVDNFGDDIGHALTVRPDGRIFVAGTTNAAGNADMLITAFEQDGTDYTPWADEGRLVRELVAGKPDEARAIFWHQQGDSFAIAGASNSDTAVLRLDEFGNPISTFGPGGARVLNVSEIAGWDKAYSVFVQDDTDNVIVSGSAFTASSDPAFYAMRLLSDGAYDSSWNGTGRTLTTFGSGTYSFAAALGPGTFPTVTVAGEATNAPTLVRYSSEPPGLTLDASGCGDMNNAMMLWPYSSAVSSTDCTVSIATNASLGMSLMISQTDGFGTALTGPEPVPDYFNGAWATSGADAFGACLRQLDAPLSPIWPVASGNTCMPVDSLAWNGVPAFTGAPNGTVAASFGPLAIPSRVYLRFGAKDDGAPLTSGEYNAGITFTAVVNP